MAVDEISCAPQDTQLSERDLVRTRAMGVAQIFSLLKPDLELIRIQRREINDFQTHLVLLEIFDHKIRAALFHVIEIKVVEIFGRKPTRKVGFTGIVVYIQILNDFMSHREYGPVTVGPARHRIIFFACFLRVINVTGPAVPLPP
ncbi:MAG: hypothetical protein JJ897_15065 [Marinibacterium sp.]|nr:hypothetical protein [Marinibacterium sp.]